MSDWRIVSIIAMVAWLILAWREFRTHRVTPNFVLRSIAIWAGIILLVTVIVVYRFEIAAFLAPIRAIMP